VTERQELEQYISLQKLHDKGTASMNCTSTNTHISTMTNVQCLYIYIYIYVYMD